MNLTKLFETQRVLNERIVNEKGLEGRDLLPEKILALQVELGELANEQRSWKFWSERREPRLQVTCHSCEGEGYFDVTSTLRNETDVIIKRAKYQESCAYCDGTGIQARPLLEEYVDCLHFILSIGIELENDNWLEVYYKPVLFDGEITECFNELYGRISSKEFRDKEFYPGYMDTLQLFLGLGEMLGFTWEQIEQAYYDKNKINHARQENGY